VVHSYPLLHHTWSRYIGSAGRKVKQLWAAERLAERCYANLLCEEDELGWLRNALQRDDTGG